jgi:hypothetical protein
MAITSTKSAVRSGTYAQKLCCSAMTDWSQSTARYKTDSACKSLIHIGLANCFFLWQFDETLDFKGLRRLKGNLSTKLSTEMLKNCKPSVNQALSVVCGCTLGQLPRVSRPLDGLA